MENVNFVQKNDFKGIDKFYAKLVGDRGKVINFSIENDILTLKTASGHTFSSPITELEVKHWSQNGYNHFLLKNSKEEFKISEFSLCFSKEDRLRIQEILLNYLPNSKSNKVLINFERIVWWIIFPLLMILIYTFA